MNDEDHLPVITSLNDYDDAYLSVLIFDFETHEVIYTNKAYASIFGEYEDLDDYQDIKNSSSIFVPRYKTVASSAFVMYSKTMMYKGRKVVFEAGNVRPKKNFDIPEETSKLTLELQINTLNKIENNFDSLSFRRDEYIKIYHQFTDLLCSFYKASYVKLFLIEKIDGVTQYVCTAKTCKDKNCSEHEEILNSGWVKDSYHYFDSSRAIILDRTANVESYNYDIAKEFDKDPTKSLVLMPLFSSNNYYGFFSVSNPQFDKVDANLFFLRLVSNLAALVEVRSRLYYSLYYDELTNMPRPELFKRLTKSWLTKYYGENLVLIKFDIIKFRLYNSTYGSSFGDRVLTKLASLLKNDKPDHVLYGRYRASDIFYLFVRDTVKACLDQINYLIEAMRDAFPEVQIDMAFGILDCTNYNGDYRTIDTKVSFAHKEARNNHLKKISIFTNEIEKKEEYEQEITNEFPSAMNNGEFEVFIQPKFDMLTGTYCGGEALSRWIRKGELIPPVKFIPVFENNGLIKTIDHHVLVEVCKNIRRWIDSGMKVVPISLNFSRTNFHDPLLFEKMIATIDNYNVPHKYIEIEVTESIFVELEDTIREFVDKCTKVGIKVDMDDFGSGLSSLSSLKDLDVSVIKLDYRFLSNSLHEYKKEKIIESIVILARSLSIPMVVEGVETEEQAKYLSDLSVKYIQGYLFGKPMPIEEFERLIGTKKQLNFSTRQYTGKLMDDILTPNSTTNFLFSRSMIPLSIVKLSENEIVPVLLNDATKNIFAQANDSKILSDLSVMFSKEDYAELKKYFAKITSGGIQNTNEGIHTHATLGRVHFNIILRATLIGRVGSSHYLLVQLKDEFIPDLSEKKNKAGAAFNQFDLTRIFDNADTGFIAIDSNNIVVYANRHVLKYYPQVKVGQDIEVGFGDIASYLKGGKNQTYYDKKLNKMFDIAPNRINVNGNKALLINLTESNKISSSEEYDELKNISYGRIFNSLYGIIDYFTQVNLKTGKFTHFNFSTTNEFNIRRYGDYQGDILRQLPMFFDVNKNNKLDKVASIDNLRHQFGVSKKLVFDMQVKKKPIWKRVTVTFDTIRGTPYALLFTQDVSSAYLKDIDSLTGFYNRSAGKRLIQNYLDNNLGNDSAFVIIDYDSFKHINDTFGHPTGDKVLVEGSKALAKFSEEFSFLTRLGGDEFCFLIKDVPSIEYTQNIESRINKIFEDVCKANNFDFVTTITCGIAFTSDVGKDFEALYAKADQALYGIKKVKKIN